MTISSIKRPRTRLPTIIHSHWHVTIEGAVFPVSQAYERLEELFSELKIPEARIGPARFKEHESVFSRKRGYIRVMYRNFSYDICVCPFGTSTFISSWLGERTPGFLRNLLCLLPIIGPIVKRNYEAKTYYQCDSLQTFLDVAHSTLLEWLDEATTSHGLKPIDNDLRKPVMKSLLKGFPSQSESWGTRWDYSEKKPNVKKRPELDPNVKWGKLITDE